MAHWQKKKLKNPAALTENVFKQGEMDGSGHNEQVSYTVYQKVIRFMLTMDNKKVEQGRVLGGHLGCNIKEGSQCRPHWKAEYKQRLSHRPIGGRVFQTEKTDSSKAQSWDDT